jgi:membrane-associated phospholipid phosphatase
MTEPGQVADAAITSAILDLLPDNTRRSLDHLARPLLPYLLAPVAALLFLRGLVRGEWRRCLAAALATPAIPLSTWVRDHVVKRPDFGAPGYDWNTFPSTHATIGFVVLGAVILLWPGRSLWSRRLRLGLAVTAGVIIFLGNVAWYAHRPVDVFGSFGIVASPLLLTLGVVFRSSRPKAVGRRANQVASSEP